MRLKDKVGLIFFILTAILAGFSAAANSSLLAWLSVPYYLTLAFLYTRRRPASRWNRTGLWLGLIAAFLPMASYPRTIPWPLTLFGLAGYALIFWSLLALGRSFGIAPADRGLVTNGPYRFVRHPMYLGELAFRCALVAASLTIGNIALMLVMAAFQVARIFLEERIIDGYEDYIGETRWRFIPGVW